MSFRHSVFGLSLAVVLALAYAPLASAQSEATATQGLGLSAFAGATGTYLGIEGGKNGSITAGADLTFFGLSRHFKPSLEIRGTYPVDSGHIASEKNFLGGVKVAYPIHRYHPYADFLVGQGEIDYKSQGPNIPGFPVLSPDGTYISYIVASNTFIYSPGGGLDYDITRHIGLKAEVQLQHWDRSVDGIFSGSAWAKAITLGVNYNFDFNPHHTWR